MFKPPESQVVWDELERSIIHLLRFIFSILYRRASFHIQYLGRGFLFIVHIIYNNMILFEEALEIVRNHANILGETTLSISDSLGKVLAEDIHSDINMPPFNKSAMDGYACRVQDLGNHLEVLEVIPAGVEPTKVVGENQCSKIMTGAPVPEGADTVIMVEYTVEVSHNVIRYTKEKSKSNICYIAEDVKEGDIVLKKGTLIEPKHIPVLASVGAVEFQVYRAPRIAIVSTGDELVEPGTKPNPSQIRNSNAMQLIAQAKQMGLEAYYIGIALDTKESTQEMLHKAMHKGDIIILSGAVSMGDFDFVPIVLKEECVAIHFHGVETKPGKKIVFGTTTNQWFIGVPGNPVSSYVQFEMLIKPLIYKIMGSEFNVPTYQLPIGFDFKRKKASRKAFEPVMITNNQFVERLDYHGSAHINALSYANAMMIIDRGITELKKGDLVDVRPI